MDDGGTRQFVIMAREGATRNGPVPPLGARRQILADLYQCNTGPEREGDDVLYGPGFRLELTPGQDPVTQMLLTITEDEIGWLALMRVAKKLQWRILDPNTGRALEP